MNTETITRDEWLAELERLYAHGSDDGWSVREILDALGRACSDRQRIMIRDALRVWIADGRVAPGRARRQSVDGTSRWVPVYRMVQGGAPCDT